MKEERSETGGGCNGGLNHEDGEPRGMYDIHIIHTYLGCFSGNLTGNYWDHRILYSYRPIDLTLDS